MTLAALFGRIKAATRPLRPFRVVWGDRSRIRRRRRRKVASLLRAEVSDGASGEVVRADPTG